MSALRFAFICAVGFAAAGCLSTKLKPGFCERDGDCQSGYRCQAQMCACDSPACDDGGMSGNGGGGSGGGGSGGGGTGGGGSGGDADGGQDVEPTCQPSCTAPRSICAPNLTCVECLTSAGCTVPTKPVCDVTGICVACSSDEQCALKPGVSPGVCMAHLDGRCATEAETIYVQNETSICSDVVGPADGGSDAGTRARPFCSMQPVPLRLSTTRALVVVTGSISGGNWTFNGQGAPQISIVGRDSAFVAAGLAPGFIMTDGSAYLRSLKLSASGTVGIRASGGTLTLERVTVDSCMGGGILLDGAAFDIRNTTITRSGPADDMGTGWGGLRIKNLPMTGPTQIALSTVRMNDGGGVSCSAAIDGGTDVLVIDNVNTAFQVSPTCGFSSCAAAGPACGAQ